MKFGSGMLSVELPFDGGLGGVALPDKGLDFPLESLLVGESMPQAGAGQHAELNLRDVQPTPVFGGVVEYHMLAAQLKRAGRERRGI